jgi:hypothetical protein
VNPLRPAPFVLALLLGLGSGACNDSPEPGRPAETPEELLRLLRTSVDELAARPEHAASEVTIQHLLIGVTGALPDVARTPAEAELLAAELLARARAGEDFDLLVKVHTDEQQSTGIYTLTTGTADPRRSTFARAGMLTGVGDVAWRLAPGEFGVVRYDGGVPGQTPKSPLGYHVVERLK